MKCKYCHKKIMGEPYKEEFCNSNCEKKYISRGRISMVEYPIRNCKVCYKEFKPISKKHIVCSDACRKEFTRIRILKKDRRKKLESRERVENIIQGILTTPRAVLDELTSEDVEDAIIERDKLLINRKNTKYKTYIRICRRCGNNYRTTSRTSKMCGVCNKNYRR